MNLLRPFRAGIYNDPHSNVDDGVLDISPVLQPGAASVSAAQFTDALANGSVMVFDVPSFYLVRVGWYDEERRPWQRSGVVGATGASTTTLDRPETVVLPDPAFSDLLVPEGVPLLRGTDSENRHLRVWSIQRPGIIETIGDAVERLAPQVDSPFVLATTDHFEIPAGMLFLPSAKTITIAASKSIQ